MKRCLSNSLMHVYILNYKCSPARGGEEGTPRARSFSPAGSNGGPHSRGAGRGTPIIGRASPQGPFLPNQWEPSLWRMNGLLARQLGGAEPLSTGVTSWRMGRPEPWILGGTGCPTTSPPSGVVGRRKGTGPAGRAACRPEPRWAAGRPPKSGWRTTCGPPGAPPPPREGITFGRMDCE